MEKIDELLETKTHLEGTEEPFHQHVSIYRRRAMSPQRAEAPPPSHLLGGLVSQLGGDMSECFPIGSSLLTGCQDGAVRLTETGRGQSEAVPHASYAS